MCEENPGLVQTWQHNWHFTRELRIFVSTWFTGVVMVAVDNTGQQGFCPMRKNICF